MKILRGAAAAGLAKKAYDIARRPENQEKMRQAATRFNERRASRGTARAGRAGRTR